MKNIIVLVMVLLSGVTLCAQDIQHFLGVYDMERKEGIYTTQCYVTIKKGTESDLLINASFFASNFYYNAFVSNDSLFIPLQRDTTILDERVGLQGKGKIEGDSLFLQFTYWFEFPYSYDCRGKKISSVSIAPLLKSDQNKVYFDAINQTIVLDETLQYQTLTLELIDIQGKEILKKTDINDSPISVANLLNGVYLYRLLQNGQAIYSGKILKTNN